MAHHGLKSDIPPLPSCANCRHRQRAPRGSAPIEFSRNQFRLPIQKRGEQETTDLQSALWFTAAKPAIAEPTPVAALGVSGMNDVLYSQGYTQAAWWNRIPVGAWALMAVVAIACDLLLGYSEVRAARTMLLFLPLVVSAAFFLLADIDSPRGGMIHVAPQNLIALSQTMKAP